MSDSDVDLDEQLAELLSHPRPDTKVHPEDGDQSAAKIDPDEEDDS
ncbi:hypothetical protein ACQP2F_31180 [Actinoplanes sp. CA-030573]